MQPDRPGQPEEQAQARPLIACHGRIWRPSADGRHILCLNVPISMSFATFSAVD
jgi:hypothetical protein